MPQSRPTHEIYLCCSRVILAKIHACLERSSKLSACMYIVCCHAQLVGDIVQALQFTQPCPDWEIMRLYRLLMGKEIASGDHSSGWLNEWIAWVVIYYVVYFALLMQAAMCGWCMYKCVCMWVCICANVCAVRGLVGIQWRYEQGTWGKGWVSM